MEALGILAHAAAIVFAEGFPKEDPRPSHQKEPRLRPACKHMTAPVLY